MSGNVNANNMIPQNRKITIKDVAREAGVSTQTISRVINNHPDVSPDTRKRIREIIDRLGYHPSELARSLIHRRSLTLGVVTAGLKYIGPNRTLNGITTKAEELGYAILLKELARFSVPDVRPILRFLSARAVDGILWAVPEVSDNRDWLAEGLGGVQIPMVFLAMEPRADITVLSIDNYAGGVLATQHLIDLGRKRIAHLSGPQDWWEARQRKQAWHDTLNKAGRRVSGHHTAEGNWSSASGQAAFEQLLVSYPDMDAIFVANDQMALSVLRMACQKGIAVPDDLAVVGFDNITESAYFWPALTTVGQDQQRLGSRAVEELVGRIAKAQNGEPVEAEQILIAPELIVRESTVRG